MAFHGAVLKRERMRRAEYIEDVAVAVGSLFDGKAANNMVRKLRTGK